MELSGYLEEVERRFRGGPENLVVLAAVDSTNTLARRIVAEYENECQNLPPSVLLAFEQSAGRGRQGRSWSSPGGMGVYATLLRQIDEPRDLQTLPLLVGVGLCRALAPHLAVAPRLKWPNDVLVGGRKIGGVLIETMTRPDACAFALLGFGVNHGQGREELPEGATSIALEAETAAGLEGALASGGPSLAELARDLVGGVEAELAHLGDAAYAVASYRSCSAHAPGEHLVCRLAEGTVEGTFLGFDENGFLRLEVDGREARLAAGEVIQPEAIPR